MSGHWCVGGAALLLFRYIKTIHQVDTVTGFFVFVCVCVVTVWYLLGSVVTSRCYGNEVKCGGFRRAIEEVVLSSVIRLYNLLCFFLKLFLFGIYLFFTSFVWIYFCKGICVQLSTANKAAQSHGLWCYSMTLSLCSE